MPLPCLWLAFAFTFAPVVPFPCICLCRCLAFTLPSSCFAFTFALLLPLPLLLLCLAFTFTLPFALACPCLCLCFYLPLPCLYHWLACPIGRRFLLADTLPLLLPAFSPRHNLFLRISRQISRKHLCTSVISAFSKLDKVARPGNSILLVIMCQVRNYFSSLFLFLEARERFLVVTFSGVGGSTYLLTDSFCTSCTHFGRGEDIMQSGGVWADLSPTIF